MKKILFILLISPMVFGCKEEIDSFNVTIPSENISFRAIAGGAVMYYKLPADKEVNAINVHYEDVFGDELLCSGSYSCDSVTLYGFNEARQGVRALVTLSDRNNLESPPTEVFFDTEDSAPVAFFDNVEVSSGWDGFIIKYSAPKDARGIAHVFYVGENPLTNEPDTILVKSFPIMTGSETIIVHQQQQKSVNDIVIRTEDFRGYFVKQKIWQNINALESVMLEYPAFDFEDPEKLSIEDDDWCLGYKYLFDGNTKGFWMPPMNELNYYAAGPHCLDRDLFIIDLREAKKVAAIRFYTTLAIARELPRDPQLFFPYDNVFRGFWSIYDMTPCNLTIYGSNDKNSWIEIGSFEDGARSSYSSRWCNRTYGTYGYDSSIGESDFIYYYEIYQAEDPCYLEVSVPPLEPFRYVKVVFHELYDNEDGPSDNIRKYTCLQELEIYIEKK